MKSNFVLAIATAIAFGLGGVGVASAGKKPPGTGATSSGAAGIEKAVVPGKEKASGATGATPSGAAGIEKAVVPGKEKASGEKGTDKMK